MECAVQYRFSLFRNRIGTIIIGGLLKFSESKKYEVISLTTDGEFGRFRLVQRTLPPIVEVAQRIGQPLPLQFRSAEREDGDLLTGLCGKAAGVSRRNEDTIIGHHTYVHSASHVFDEQADIAQRMIFTFARGADNCDSPESPLPKIADGFRLVVRLLIGDIMNDGSEPLSVFG